MEPEKAPEKTQQKEASPEAAEAVPEITFDDFLKLDLRVGKILEVLPVEKSKKLIRVMADFGTEKRQAVAGLISTTSLKSWWARNACSC
jgi:tRNA-binding EMAP/Myf-like protein